MNDLFFLHIKSKDTFVIIDAEAAAPVLNKNKVWSMLPNGYASARIKEYGRSPVSLHRLLMGCPEGRLIDHKNRLKFDNRLCNLRITDFLGNTSNARKQARASSSKYKGVHWRASRRRWVASHKGTWLGMYKTQEEAARRWNEVVRERCGEFAYQNPI